MKWEYLILQMDMMRNAITDNEKRLNNLGSQGWEIVSVGTYDDTVHIIYLKRKWDRP